jgi:hypothetical protein
MDKSPREGDIHSANQGFLPFMEPKVYYCVHKSPPLDPVLGQMNPVHILITYFKDQF